MTPAPDTPEPRDWPEDFTDENGNYHCLCSICGNRFIGYKRRIICKLCSRAPELAKWKHVARGSIVTEIGRGRAQVSRVPINEMSRVVVYEHDGNLWVRNALEFDDGRFVPVSPAASPAPPVDVAALLEQVAVLRRALVSFCDLADALDNCGWRGMPDSIPVSEGSPNIKIGDLRRARAALNLTGGRP